MSTSVTITNSVHINSQIIDEGDNATLSCGSVPLHAVRNQKRMIIGAALCLR